MSGETSAAPPAWPSTTTAWSLLAGAVLAELVGTVSMKAAHGFARPWWGIGILLGFGVSLGMFGILIRVLRVGVVYAVWSGAGTALSAVAGVLFYDERLSPLQLVGLVVVIVGIVVLRLREG